MALQEKGMVQHHSKRAQGKHYFKYHLNEAVLMSVSIKKVLIKTNMLSHHPCTVKVSKHS